MTRACRIALIGNMNNSNFALLRYLRDLGADAYLFLYNNELCHFLPQLDTTRWEKWRSYIRQLPVSNGGLDGMFGSLAGVNEALKGFDAFLGNGIAPVLFWRMKKRLDVFVPYGEGVEHVAEFVPNWKRPVSATFRWTRKKMMERALLTSVGEIVTANQSPKATATYRRLGLDTVAMPIVVKYDDEALDEAELGDLARSAVERMRKASIAVFSQTQHRWLTQLGGAYPPGGKKNDWLVEGFARYVGHSGDDGAVLVLLEYGPDVDATKRLCAQLGIDGQVVWLPAMTRLELLAIARAADVGADAFMSMIWGGTGWELISLGKPILHQVGCPHAYNWPGMSLPAYFEVSGPDQIAQILLSHDRGSLARIGREVAEWHRQHQGIALARRYLSLLNGEEPEHRIAHGHRRVADRGAAP